MLLFRDKEELKRIYTDPVFLQTNHVTGVSPCQVDERPIEQLLETRVHQLKEVRAVRVVYGLHTRWAVCPVHHEAVRAGV